VDRFAHDEPSVNGEAGFSSSDGGHATRDSSQYRDHDYYQKNWRTFLGARANKLQTYSIGYASHFASSAF
jgi:hypothetical protein